MKKSRCFRALLVILSMVIFSWASPALDAEGIELGAGGVSTDYRPGKTNPIVNPERRCLIAQETLGISSSNYKSIGRAWNGPIDDYLHDWKSLEQIGAYSVPEYNITECPIASAKGRVLSMLRDDVFIVFYTGDITGGCTNKPVVAFQECPMWNYTIPGTYYQQQANYAIPAIDIAIGDIDGETDENGEMREEIVIAYRKKNAGDGYGIWITALKANSNVSYTVLDSIQTNDPVVDFGYSFLSLTTGDYDNDGIEEIAVAYRTSDLGQYHLCTLDYENGKLAQKDVITDYLDTKYNSVDIASGDFDGDGPDEIAAVFGRNTNNCHNDCNGVGNYLNTYKMDENLKITRKGSYCGTWHDKFISNKGVAITSGLFKYDPDNNYTVARRQLAAIVMNQPLEYSWAPYIITFDVDNNLQPTLVSAIDGLGPLSCYLDKQNVACLKPEITAGRFLTFENGWINDSIAASWGVTPTNGSSSNMVFNVYAVDYNLNLSIPGQQGGFYINPHQQGYSCCSWNMASIPIVAACREEGKSYYLGTPVHLTIPTFIRPNRVIQEPPKHVDFLPDENGEWKVINASRSRTFYASFEDVEGSSITTTSSSQTNWNVGGSNEVTAGGTVGGGIPFIEKAEISTTASKKVENDYEDVTKKLNGNYSEVKILSKFETRRDDYVQAFIQEMDIWRYPIYGLKTNDGKNAFYEVVMPGPSYKINASGCDISDYYQPIHENGNILSYPLSSDSNFPYDVGSFNVAGKDYDAPMTGDTTLLFSSMTGMQGVSWAEENWDTEEKSHTHKLSENYDLKVGCKITSFCGGVSSDMDISFHNENSWSGTSFSENKTSSNKGITIYLPDDSETQYAYSFKPVVYSTKDGTLKLAHSVNTSGSAQGSWWQNHYRGQPDISLNLPKKFYWKPNPEDPEFYGTWYLGKTRQLRSRMRGVYLLSKEPDLNDREKDFYLASAPTAGDKIWVLTRVHNYSFDTATGPFKVRFSYADYNSNLGDDEPSLTTIGETSIDNLDPLERKEVYVEWDTTGLGGSAPGSGKSYVIYVTVDPDNDVKNEFHELYAEDQTPPPSGPCPTDKDQYSEECGIFCGSNNQGYWPWDNSFMIFAPKTGEENDNEPAVDISTAQKSLEVEFTPESQGYGPYIFTHLPYRLKLKVVASQAVKDHRELLFYDNDKVFSMKRAFGLNPGENDFYCRWTPREPGEHTLKVAILEHEDDPGPGNAIVTLDVEVLDIKIPPHR